MFRKNLERTFASSHDRVQREGHSVILALKVYRLMRGTYPAMIKNVK